jgi:hypothetical protein
MRHHPQGNRLAGGLSASQRERSHHHTQVHTGLTLRAFQLKCMDRYALVLWRATRAPKQAERIIPDSILPCRHLMVHCSVMNNRPVRSLSSSMFGQHDPARSTSMQGCMLLGLPDPCIREEVNKKARGRRMPEAHLTWHSLRLVAFPRSDKVRLSRLGDPDNQALRQQYNIGCCCI